MGYTNPADKAMPYLNQVPGTISPYYNPYINAGNQELSALLGQFSTLMNNPNQVMDMLGSGFQSSPGYQYQYNQAMNAANGAAASGGMLGTPYQENMAAGMATNLANQDYYNYLDNTKDLFKTGLAGAQGINQMGYNASDALASALGTNLNNQAGLAYQGQANKNQSDADFWKSLISGGGAIIGGYLGSGNNHGNSGNQAPNMQGYGSSGQNGMLGPGGTQQSSMMDAIKNKLAELFHGSGNGVNSGGMGGYY